MKFALSLAAACAAGLLSAPALADDPNDPAMRSYEARERDREQIREMNLRQAETVRQRDASYAEGWREWREAKERGGDYQAQSRDYQRANADYERRRAKYERDMARWESDVAACRAGDYSACD